MRRKRVVKSVLMLMSLLLCLVPVAFFAIVLDGNHSCFGTLWPTISDVSRNGWISFPPSARNIHWTTTGFQCIANVDFEMSAADLAPFIEQMNFDRVIASSDGGASGKVFYQGDTGWKDTDPSLALRGIRANGRFNQNVVMRRNDSGYDVQVESNQWPYSTTRRFDQTPGWFENFYTPSPASRQ